MKVLLILIKVSFVALALPSCTATAILLGGDKSQNDKSSEENSKYIKRSELYCWNVLRNYVKNKEGKILYSSKAEGLIKAEFSGEQIVRFEIQKVTSKKNYLKVEAWYNLALNQKLSQKYLNEISEKLK